MGNPIKMRKEKKEASIKKSQKKISPKYIPWTIEIKKFLDIQLVLRNARA